MHQSIPGYREDDSGWRYIFPDDRRIGFNLMNRVVAVGCHGAAYCRETLPVRLDGINRFAQGGKSVLDRHKHHDRKSEAEKKGTSFSFHGRAIPLSFFIRILHATPFTGNAIVACAA